MDTTVTTGEEENVWGGGNRPLGASYGKLMMWFFIVSDALTFSGFLAAYGFSRFKFMETWPIADEVFTHVPFFHGNYPMIYVAFMTFILIMSSVTMVLAVDAGHKMKQNAVIWYMFLTIIGGAIFVGSQAWEWATFIKGDYGAVETQGGRLLQFENLETGKRVALADFVTSIPSERVQSTRGTGLWYEQEGTLPTYSMQQITEGLKADASVVIRTESIVQEGEKEGEKTVLTREQSLEKIKEGKNCGRRGQPHSQ